MHNIHNIAKQCSQCWSIYVWYDLIGYGYDSHPLEGARVSATLLSSLCFGAMALWFDTRCLMRVRSESLAVKVVESWDAKQRTGVPIQAFLRHIHSHYILLYPSVCHSAEREIFSRFSWDLAIKVGGARTGSNLHKARFYTCLVRAWRRRNNSTNRNV